MLKEALNVDAELKLGSGGIFQVEVDGKVVAQRSFIGFPSEREIIHAVSRALGR